MNTEPELADESSLDDFDPPQTVPVQTTIPVGLDRVAAQHAQSEQQTNESPPPKETGLFSRLFGGKDDVYNEQKKERRLRSQIRHLRRMHPDIDLSKISDDEMHLKSLNVDELEEVLESIKSQICGPSPFASATTIIAALTEVAERKWDMPGYSQTCADDLDLVTAIDELIPEQLASASGPLTIGWRLVKNYLDTQKSSKKDEHAVKQTNTSSSMQSDGDGKIPDGEDSLRSQHTSPKSKTKRKSINRGSTDILDAGDVQPVKKVRIA